MVLAVSPDRRREVLDIFHMPTESATGWGMLMDRLGSGVGQALPRRTNAELRGAHQAATTGARAAGRQGRSGWRSDRCIPRG